MKKVNFLVVIVVIFFVVLGLLTLFGRDVLFFKMPICNVFTFQKVVADCNYIKYTDAKTSYLAVVVINGLVRDRGNLYLKTVRIDKNKKLIKEKLLVGPIKKDENNKVVVVKQSERNLYPLTKDTETNIYDVAEFESKFKQMKLLGRIVAVFVSEVSNTDGKKLETIHVYQ